MADAAHYIDNISSVERITRVDPAGPFLVQETPDHALTLQICIAS